MKVVNIGIIVLSIVIEKIVLISGFERAEPIVWIHSKHRVTTGTGLFHIEYKIRNGCDFLRDLLQVRVVALNLSVSEQAINRLVELCNEDYEKKFLPQLKEFENCFFYYEQSESLWEKIKGTANYIKKRAKRWVAMLIIGTIIIITILAAAITTPAVVLNEKVEKANCNLDDARKEIVAIKDQQKISLEIDLKTVTATNKIVQKTEDIITSFKEFSLTTAELAWTSSKVWTNMDDNTKVLKGVTTNCKKGIVDPEQIKELLANNNLDELMNDIQAHETVLLGVNKIHEDLYTIEFTAPIRDKTTRIFKVESFPHMMNLTAPTWAEYNGPTYVLHNITANCTKGLNLDQGTGDVFELCDKRNYTDPSLQKWEVREYEKNYTSKIIHTKQSTFVYCPHETIIVDNESIKCPHYAFKLDNSIPFKMGNAMNNGLL